MKPKPAHEMTVSECEARLAAVKRDPRCLPQDIEYWLSYIDFHNSGRDVVAATKLAEERRQQSKPRVRVQANSHCFAPSPDASKAKGRASA